MNQIPGSLEENAHPAQVGVTGLHVATAVATVGFGTLVVKLVQGVQELTMAYRFGAGDALDAFFVAYAALTFLLGVLGAAFSNAFLPAFHGARQRVGPVSVQVLISHLAFAALSLLVLVAAAASIAAPWWIRVLTAGFSQPKRLLTIALFRDLLPLLVLGGFAMFGSVLLNFDGRFAIAALAPVAVPASALSYLLVARPATVTGLSRSLVFGTVIHLCWVLIEARRRKLLPLPRPARVTGEMRGALREYGFVAAGALIICTNPVVDQAMAAPLGVGSVSVWNYASRPIYFLLAVGAAGIGTAVMPYLSEAVALRKWEQAEALVKKGCLLILATTVPVAAMIVFGGARPIVQILFVRGAFTSADAERVREVLSVCALTMPPFLICILVPRLISALQANRVLALGAIASALVNVVLDYVLRRFLGVRGIAWSSVVVYTLLAPAYWIAMKRALRRAKSPLGRPYENAPIDPFDQGAGVL